MQKCQFCRYDNMVTQNCVNIGIAVKSRDTGACDRHFAEDVFKDISINENRYIFIKV